MQNVIKALHEIAPLHLAEEWDNVGLLLDRPAAGPVARIQLCIDLTEAVLDEAIAAQVDLIIAYHPPIFAPLKRLTMDDVKSRILLRAMAAGIAIYSPHTALDNVEGGVNDWLADGLGASTRSPADPESGAGRLVILDQTVSLEAISATIRAYLGLGSLRVASAATEIRRIALCAGAGASVLGGVQADLYWTGEMRHHDVLSANAAGTSVILCEHTNTERGYLPTLKAQLSAHTDAEILISTVDRDPLVSL